MTHIERLKLALEYLKDGMPAHAMMEIKEAIEQAEQADKEGSPCPEFWDWLPKAYNFEGDGNFTKYNMEVAFLAGKQAQERSDVQPVAWRDAAKAAGFSVARGAGLLPSVPEDAFIGNICVTRELQKFAELMTPPPRQPEQAQAVEHCIWARNGNTPCPHTTPPRQPLTDEQLKPFCDANHIIFGAYTLDFIRAIEAAHGITKENT